MNLSRELLQNNGLLIGKLRDILSKRVIRWLKDQMVNQPEKYREFYGSCGFFVKEGVCTDQTRKQQIVELLMFESSGSEARKLVSLSEYVSRMKEDQKDIYYLVAPNRQSAMESPYLEPFLAKGYEVLFLYEDYDRMVAQAIESFQGKYPVKSAEKVGAELQVDQQQPHLEEGEEALTDEQCKELCEWIASEQALGKKTVSQVEITKRFTTFPAIIVDHEESGFYRAYARKMFGDMADQHELPHKLEINANHILIRRLFDLKSKAPVTAKLIVSQIFDNALLAAGELSNPRRMLKRVNSIMESLVTGKELISEEEKEVKTEATTGAASEAASEATTEAASKQE